MTDRIKRLYAGRPNEFGLTDLFALHREGESITLALRDLGVTESRRVTLALGEQAEIGGDTWRLIELPKIEASAEEKPGTPHVAAVFEQVG